jgi:hypothetical protein
MQEMPMTAWGIAAFALALEYRRHPRAAWLIASAAAASFATSIKLTGGLFAGSAALLLFFGGIERRTISRRPRLLIPSLYLAGVGALSWIALAWIDGRTPADWLGSHWIALRSAPSGWAERLSELANGLTTHAWPVILLAGLAALSGSDWGSEPSRARVAFVALVLPVATFHLIIRPWWGFYAVSAVAVLVPAAGIAVAHAWSALGKGGLIERVRWKWPSQATTIRFSVVLVALGAAGMGWIERWNLWRAAPRTGESPVVRAIREFESDGPAGCLYAADAMDAFWTGVPVPPELLVVTEKRFLSGSLPQDGVPRALARAGCDFIVLPDGSAATRGPAWDSLLARDYVRVAVGGGKELFVHRELDPSPHESRLRW